MERLKIAAVFLAVLLGGCSLKQEHRSEVTLEVIGGGDQKMSVMDDTLLITCTAPTPKPGYPMGLCGAICAGLGFAVEFITK